MKNKKAEIYQDYHGDNFFIVRNDDSMILCAKIDDDFCSTSLYLLDGHQPIRGNETKGKYFHGKGEITKEEYEKIKSQYVKEIDAIYKENAGPDEPENICGVGWLVLDLQQSIGNWEI